ncbi:MAG TPA: 3-isopropylmalate dehydratase small subunit [Fibrobacteria bacterium]|nr:3-isopropylmalate dehydratase small subunit [Fibrobacteria bacterium]
MSEIKKISGTAVPVRGNDIDTDRIIPARFLRCVSFDGLGEHAFEDDRAQDKAKGKTHPFDDARFQGAKVLVSNSNFGCGSSREHAPQAIYRWGVRAIVAVSYSEIFYGNTVAMGMPCVHVSAADAEAIQSIVEADPKAEVVVDIEANTVTAAGKTFSATVPEGPRKQFLTGGWDATSELLKDFEDIRSVARKLPYVNAFA